MFNAGIVPDQDDAFGVLILIDHVVERANRGVVDLRLVGGFHLTKGEGGGFPGALRGGAENAVVLDAVTGEPFARGAGFVLAVLGEFSLAVVLAILAGFGLGVPQQDEFVHGYRPPLCHLRWRDR